MPWEPLPEGGPLRKVERLTDFVDVTIRGTIYANRGEITGDVIIGGDVEFQADVQSSDWDGADPADLSGGPDGAATAGYYLDYSAGAAQFQSIYVNSLHANSGQDLELWADNERRVQVTANDINFYDNGGTVAGYWDESEDRWKWAKNFQATLTTWRLYDSTSTERFRMVGGSDLAFYDSGGNLALAYDDSVPEWVFYDNVDFASGVGITVESWNSPTLVNSWVNYGGSFVVARYRKTPDGTVHVQGLVKNGSASATIFTLPTGYRPSGSLIFPVLTSTGMGRIDVTSAGLVNHNSGGTGWVSINFSFQV